MQQAWHIFKKDCRYLWREIILLLVLAAGFCFTLGDIFEGIGAAAAAFVIARLIYAEAIPGENQFWITRPYRWKSLLAAKLMFIVAFINLPVLVAHLIDLLLRGFPIGAILPGLLWSQFLIFFGVALPLTALVAMMPGIVPFAGTALTLILLVAFAPSRFGFPVQFEWILNMISLIAAVLVCPLILYWQYRSRRTLLSRTVAVSVLVGLSLVTFSLSWTTVFGIQAALSKQVVDAEVTRDPAKPLEFWPTRSQLQIKVPVAIHVPAGLEPKIEGYRISLVAPDGRVFRPNQERLALGDWITKSRYHLLLFGVARMDPAFYDLERGQPLTMRIAFYVTLFGNEHAKTIQLTKRPQNVMDGLQCYAGFRNQLVCAAPFRWPARYVSEKTPGGALSSFTHLISYSPFPAMLGIQPVATEGLVYYSEHAMEDERPVTIDVQEPVAYVERDIEIRNVKVGVNR